MRIVVALGFTLVSLAVMAAGVTLWQEGEADIVGRAGDLIIMPLKKVHTAMTGAEPTTLVVFRVHEQGQPERTLVDEGLGCRLHPLQRLCQTHRRTPYVPY